MNKNFHKENSYLLNEEVKKNMNTESATKK